MKDWPKGLKGGDGSRPVHREEKQPRGWLADVVDVEVLWRRQRHNKLKERRKASAFIKNSLAGSLEESRSPVPWTEYEFQRAKIRPVPPRGPTGPLTSAAWWPPKTLPPSRQQDAGPWPGCQRLWQGGRYEAQQLCFKKDPQQPRQMLPFWETVG